MVVIVCVTYFHYDVISRPVVVYVLEVVGLDTNCEKP